MNLPQLTAEESLYQSKGHYRTNARTNLVGSCTRTIASIYPTQTTWGQATEVIYRPRHSSWRRDGCYMGRRDYNPGRWRHSKRRGHRRLPTEVASWV